MSTLDTVLMAQMDHLISKTEAFASDTNRQVKMLATLVAVSYKRELNVNETELKEMIERKLTYVDDMVLGSDGKPI